MKRVKGKKKVIVKTHKRGRPVTKRGIKLKPSSYQPNKAELEQDMSIKGATPEQVAQAVLTRVEIKQEKG